MLPPVCFVRPQAWLIYSPPKRISYSTHSHASQIYITSYSLLALIVPRSVSIQLVRQLCRHINSHLTTCFTIFLPAVSQVEITRDAFISLLFRKPPNDRLLVSTHLAGRDTPRAITYQCFSKQVKTIPLVRDARHPHINGVLLWINISSLSTAVSTSVPTYRFSQRLCLASRIFWEG